MILGKFNCKCNWSENRKPNVLMVKSPAFGGLYLFTQSTASLILLGSHERGFLQGKARRNGSGNSLGLAIRGLAVAVVLRNVKRNAHRLCKCR